MFKMIVYSVVTRSNRRTKIDVKYFWGRLFFLNLFSENSYNYKQTLKMAILRGKKIKGLTVYRS